MKAEAECLKKATGPGCKRCAERKAEENGEEGREGKGEEECGDTNGGGVGG